MHKVCDVYEVSTLYGLSSIMAILDAENEQHVIAASDRPRLLLVSNNVANPEVDDTLISFCRKTSVVFSRFKGIVYLNDLIWPAHPAHWMPSKDQTEARVQRSLFLAALGCRAVVNLYVESIQVAPSLALAKIFSGARIHVYADGLMTYGPTRFDIPLDIGARLQALHYAELVPGLTPQYLSEFGVELRPTARQRLLSVFRVISDARELADPVPDIGDGVVFLGQYLSNLGLMSVDDEASLYLQGMLQLQDQHRACRVYFKGHPNVSRQLLATLKLRASQLELDLAFLENNLLLEEYLLRSRPKAIGGVFSTGLFTASQLFDIPASAFGNEPLFASLRPFANSNRVPVALAWYVLEAGDDLGAQQLEEKVWLICAAMQPRRYFSADLMGVNAEKFAGIPVDSDDPIEMAARRQLGRTMRLVRAGVEPGCNPSHKAALMLFDAGEFDLALDMALKCLSETPTSTLNYQLAKKALIALGRANEVAGLPRPPKKGRQGRWQIPNRLRQLVRPH
jgi:hypothetical protein